MTTFSFTPLVQGAPDNASDVNTPLTALQAVLNGGLDTNNLVASPGFTSTHLASNAAIADTQLASPNNATYKSQLACGAYMGGLPTASYALLAAGAGTLPYASTAGPAPPAFYFLTADHAVAGKTTTFRTDMQVSVGATSPSTTVLTAGLYPLTVSGGNYGIGSVVAGSTIASSGLATNTVSKFSSSTYAASALTTGTVYVLAVVVTTLAVPAGIGANVQLSRCNV